MATESIRVSETFGVTAARLYDAWLSGAEHAKMTGGPAAVDAREGGKHSAWDGYITGRIVSLTPNARIVQTWRTTEFPEDAPDSRLEVRFESAGRDGTTVVIVHSDIPEGQGEKYETGWFERYFEPMSKHFAG